MADYLDEQEFMPGVALDPMRAARARLFNRNLRSIQGLNSDERGMLNKAVDKSLVARGGQPGGWEAMSPAQRQHYIQARTRLAAGATPLASVSSQAAAVGPMLVGTVGAQGGAADVRRFRPGSASGEEAKAEAMATMRQRFNEQARLRAAQIKAENGGKLPTSKERIAARNEDRAKRRLDYMVARGIAMNAPQLEAIRLQHQGNALQSAEARLKNAQAGAIEGAGLGPAPGGAPAAPVPQPAAPAPQPQKPVQMRPQTWWERYLESFQRRPQLPGPGRAPATPDFAGGMGF